MDHMRPMAPAPWSFQSFSFSRRPHAWWHGNIQHQARYMPLFLDAGFCGRV